jgi:hypothetical protein
MPAPDGTRQLNIEIEQRRSRRPTPNPDRAAAGRWRLPAWARDAARA